jgi:NhaP-type Na+/H+ or K+/H+ antiporter
LRLCVSGACAGESVLNDAVAIVLFRVLCELHDNQTPFTFSTIPSVLGQFVWISLGSTVIGVVVSFATAGMLKVGTLTPIALKATASLRRAPSIKRRTKAPRPTQRQQEGAAALY